MRSISSTPESLAILVAKPLNHAFKVTVRAFDRRIVRIDIVHDELLYDFIQILPHGVPFYEP